MLLSDAKHDHLHHNKIQQLSVRIKLQEQAPPSSQSTNYSLVDMDLTAPGPSRIQTRKRQLEEEEDQVPEQLQPLVVSTLNVSCYLLL